MENKTKIGFLVGVLSLSTLVCVGSALLLKDDNFKAITADSGYELAITTSSSHLGEATPYVNTTSGNKIIFETTNLDTSSDTSLFSIDTTTDEAYLTNVTQVTGLNSITVSGSLEGSGAVVAHFYEEEGLFLYSSTLTLGTTTNINYDVSIIELEFETGLTGTISSISYGYSCQEREIESYYGDTYTLTPSTGWSEDTENKIITIDTALDDKTTNQEYVFSGYYEGQIVFADTLTTSCRFLLNGAYIKSTSGSAITWAAAAKKLKLKATNGSVNYIECTDSENHAVLSNKNLDVGGDGTIHIISAKSAISAGDVVLEDDSEDGTDITNLKLEATKKGINCETFAYSTTTAKETSLIIDAGTTGISSSKKGGISITSIIDTFIIRNGEGALETTKTDATCVFGDDTNTVNLYVYNMSSVPPFSLIVDPTLNSESIIYVDDVEYTGPWIAA